MRYYTVSVVLLAGFAIAAFGQQPARPRVPVSLAVEAEGPPGLAGQSTTNLTKPQLQEMENLIRVGLGKDNALMLVEQKDTAAHLHLTVVVA